MRIFYFYSFLFTFVAFIINGNHLFATVAKVNMMKGEVKSKSLTSNNIKSLAKDDWLDEGDIIQTGEKSFVKLIFSDQSQVNLGPNSKMAITKFSKENKKEPGLITLLNGQVRAKVAKDYLKAAEDQGNSKLFVKTKTAAMGVRGTDFQVVFNGENNVTSLVTFSGEVAMSSISPTESLNLNNPKELETKVKSETAVSVTKGQFSGANPNQERPTLPVKISPAQFSSLEKNDNMTESENTEKKRFQSPIPPGVSSKAFVNTTNTESLDGQLKTSLGGEKAKEVQVTSQQETAKDLAASPTIENSNKDIPPPEGMYDKSTGAFAPPAGGFVDVKTGLYVAPPPGSQFDPAQGVYIPPPTVGGIDMATGSFLPPQGFKLSNEGTFIANKVEPTANNKTEGKGSAATGTGLPATTSATTGQKLPPPLPPPPPQTALMVKPGEMPYQNPNAAVMVNSATGTINYLGPIPMTGTNAPTGYLPPPETLITNIVDQKVTQVVQQVVDNQQTNLNSTSTFTQVKIFINIAQ